MKIKNLFYRLMVRLGIYKERGFTQLMYRGVPIVQREDMPDNEIGFFDERSGKFKTLNIKTGKVTKFHTKITGFDLFAKKVSV